MRVKCLAQEHNTMSPARASTRNARPGDERTNHEATAPPAGKDITDCKQLHVEAYSDKWDYILYGNLLSFTYFLRGPCNELFSGMASRRKH